MLRPWIFALLLLGPAAPAAGQTADIKARLAQSYERSGDFEAAVKLYKELFDKSPSNPVYFESLRRCYLQLKRYDDAIALLTNALRQQPADVGLMAQLGALYIQKSDETSAAGMWERALAAAPASETTYRIVAGTMIEGRMFDRAITVYRRGRTALKNDELFTNDIAYLYAMSLNYAEATREYLKLLRQTPAQLGYIQSRIGSYTGKAEGLAAATKVVEEAVGRESNRTEFQQLFAWLAMEAKDYDKAYEVYRTVDRAMQAGGKQLYTFAERALKERGLGAAGRAFQEIITSYPAFDLIAEAKFGYARTLEETAILRDSARGFAPFTEAPVTIPAPASAPLYAGAIEAYRGVIAGHPGTEVAARTLLRIASLQQDRLFDLKGARKSCEDILASLTIFPHIVQEARLRLGDVFLAEGNLDAAAQQYAAAEQQRASTPMREAAGYRSAEVEYFQGQIDKALARLRDLSRNAVSDVTNDALKLQVFLQDNRASKEALAIFAGGELLERRQKLPEALDAFRSVLKAEKLPPTLAGPALLHCGDLLARMGRFAEAVASYDTLVSRFPDDLGADLALMKTAVTYEAGVRDPAKAMVVFQRLLTDYPHSIFVTEARKRTRALRGDTL